MVILLILVFGSIALFEVPGLVKRRYWRELAAFAFFLAIGFTLNLLIMVGKPWPPHATAITNFFKAIFPSAFEAIKM